LGIIGAQWEKKILEPFLSQPTKVMNVLRFVHVESIAYSKQNMIKSEGKRRRLILDGRKWDNISHTCLLLGFLLGLLKSF